MRYVFTHPFREIFADLQHGVNALVHPADPSAAVPEGSTVILSPGDELETKTGYPHPHLNLLDEAVSEAAALLSNVQKSDIVTELADALRAERSSDAAAHEAPADQSAPVVQAAPVSPPAAPVADVPAPTADVPVAKAPAVPVEAAPAVEAPATPAPAAAPAAPVVDTPAAAPATA